MAVNDVFETVALAFQKAEELVVCQVSFARTHSGERQAERQVAAHSSICAHAAANLDACSSILTGLLGGIRLFIFTGPYSVPCGCHFRATSRGSRWFIGSRSRIRCVTFWRLLLVIRDRRKRPTV